MIPYKPDIDNIEDGLWLGAAVPHVPDGIHAIVNLVDDTDPCCRLPTGIYARIMFAPIPDGPYRKGMEWLDSTVDTILRWKREQLSILIHCSAGISRSAFVTAAVLMKEHCWDKDKALDHIGAFRPGIHPNKWFAMTLTDYYKHLHKTDK